MKKSNENSKKIKETEPVKSSPHMEEAKDLYLRCRLDEAFPLFQKAAAAGDGEAMYFLGEYYTQGYGHVRQDLEKGEKWREKGAKKGNILARLNTAFAEKESPTVRMCICNMLFPEILKMSEAGDIFAQNELADLYLYGFGISPDVKKAIYWLKKAGDRGFWRPLNKLGEVYLSDGRIKKDVKAARECFQKAADMGYGEAEANLGYLYYNEKPTHPEKCAWYMKCAFAHGFLHDADAACFLGEIYTAGDGVKKDEAEGLAWAKRSADLGNGRGMRNLGLHYEKGWGTPQNSERAIYWYKKSAEAGFADGMIACGVALRETGKEAEAVPYFQNAAEKGYPPGMVWYASCYLYGIGTEVNRETALLWLKRAAILGDEDGKRLLAEEMGRK